ncbi:LuxR C-terminal-related transcriptional regulator [Cereibacter johrii]|uniref:response regulator transcription factor n=1 Tax=Cereibacter johrii TaxID=445629 RepID=UPI000DCEC39E|nr:response regulator transcription factor [Cereibacter johrii]QCP87939.1 response regulator transcription factor [Cereibacter sphaeroides]RAZ82868.1 DNA-binding response regulator [Cereibacter johrii]
MSQRRIAIADDHCLVREVMAHFLRAEMEADVRQASSVGELETLIETEGPFDVILLDLIMPGMTPGLDAISRIKSMNQGGPILLFSGSASPGVIYDALDRGLSGYIEKSQSARSLVNAINFVLAGETYIPMTFRLNAARASINDEKGLSPKEVEVLRCLINGMMNKEIGQSLSVSEVTVKMHVRSICAKLNVKNRTQAAMVGSQFLLA